MRQLAILCAMLVAAVLFAACDEEPESTPRVEWDGGDAHELSADAVYRSRLLGWERCSHTGVCAVLLDRDRVARLRTERSEPVLLSETDRHPSVLLRDDRLAADFGEVVGAVRSDASVAAGSGVSYFEVEVLIGVPGAYGFGVATGDAPLEALPGASEESFGMLGIGTIHHGDRWLARVDPPPKRVGFVVDYRATTPTVFVIAAAAGAPEVVHGEPLETSAPLHIVLAGSKHAPTWHLAVNAGNDTVNAPFGLDARAALGRAGLDDLAAAMIDGFGRTYAGPVDEPPVLRAPPDVEARPGAPVALAGAASDPEDGDLTSAMTWEILSSPHYAGRLRGRGGTFLFTPDAIGRHPVRMRVADVTGRSAEATVMVRALVPVTQIARPRLTPDARSGPGIELSPDGLAARWTAEGKNGIRLNQSLYGAFWYFEIERIVAPINQGGGLVIGAGNLAPYTYRDVPPSCSINTLDGVYRDLMWHSDFPEPPERYTHYGFAVDYRGVHPIVYIIAGGEVIDELVLDDVWVEVYPMLYGNPTGLSARGQQDLAINLGARPFAYRASAVLAAYGVDTRGFVEGWGR